MLLIKIEILFFFLSFFYIIYYFVDKLLLSYSNMKKIVAPSKQEVEKKVREKIKLDNKDKVDLEDYKKQKLSEKQKEELNEILKRVKMNAERGYFDSAKHLIVEGLAIDKYNKSLNLELAAIYEKENDYKKSMYIYNDLIGVYHDDAEVMKKLAFAYAMDNDLEKSFDCYEKVFKKKRTDFEVIRMLADLAYDMKRYKKALKYTNLFLKEKPRDVDKLLMKAVCLEKLNQNEDALSVYRRIQQLQPYNNIARDKIKALSAFEW